MKTVEQKNRPIQGAPSVYWADEIEVREAGVVLNLSGIKRIPASTRTRDRDLMNGYFEALTNANPKSSGENTSPHIVFANCGGDSALRKYVSSNGPVLAEPASVQVRATRGGVKVQAQQRWEVLRREQQTLNAVMRVFEQTRSDRKSVV